MGMELMALRQVLLRVLGLGRGGADELDADEGEDGDLEAGDEAHEAVSGTCRRRSTGCEAELAPFGAVKPVTTMTMPTTIRRRWRRS